jgi:[NiFe] hydrogenase assembly HybE family chaperone
MSEAVTLHADPSAALEAVYRRVQVRMAGLPFVNDRLGVAAVGFAPWKAHWLGVVITPWFMNLVIAPREAAQWRSLPAGEKRRYAFPAGDYDFVSAREDGVGEFFVCSLFSPVTQFEDQATARFVAAHALGALHDPANNERAAPPGPVVEVEGKLEKPMSRRDLLRGQFLPGTDDGSRR